MNQCLTLRAYESLEHVLATFLPTPSDTEVNERELWALECSFPVFYIYIRVDIPSNAYLASPWVLVVSQLSKEKSVTTHTYIIYFHPVCLLDLWVLLRPGPTTIRSTLRNANTVTRQQFPSKSFLCFYDTLEENPNVPSARWVRK